MNTKIESAEKIAAFFGSVGDYAAKVWVGGNNVRVYVKKSGRDYGYVDMMGDTLATTRWLGGATAGWRDRIAEHVAGIEVTKK